MDPDEDLRLFEQDEDDEASESFGDEDDYEVSFEDVRTGERVEVQIDPLTRTVSNEHFGRARWHTLPPKHLTHVLKNNRSIFELERALREQVGYSAVTVDTKSVWMLAMGAIESTDKDSELKRFFRGTRRKIEQLAIVLERGKFILPRDRSKLRADYQNMAIAMNYAGIANGLARDLALQNEREELAALFGTEENISDYTRFAQLLTLRKMRSMHGALTTMARELRSAPLENAMRFLLTEQLPDMPPTPFEKQRAPDALDGTGEWAQQAIGPLLITVDNGDMKRMSTLRERRKELTESLTGTPFPREAELATEQREIQATLAQRRAIDADSTRTLRARSGDIANQLAVYKNMRSSFGRARTLLRDRAMEAFERLTDIEIEEALESGTTLDEIRERLTRARASASPAQLTGLSRQERRARIAEVDRLASLLDAYETAANVYEARVSQTVDVMTSGGRAGRAMARSELVEELERVDAEIARLESKSTLHKTIYTNAHDVNVARARGVSTSASMDYENSVAQAFGIVPLDSPLVNMMSAAELLGRDPVRNWGVTKSPGSVDYQWDCCGQMGVDAPGCWTGRPDPKQDDPIPTQLFDPVNFPPIEKLNDPALDFGVADVQMSWAAGLTLGDLWSPPGGVSTETHLARFEELKAISDSLGRIVAEKVVAFNQQDVFEPLEFSNYELVKFKRAFQLVRLMNAGFPLETYTGVPKTISSEIQWRLFLSKRVFAVQETACVRGIYTGPVFASCVLPGLNNNRPYLIPLVREGREYTSAELSDWTDIARRMRKSAEAYEGDDNPFAGVGMDDAAAKVWYDLVTEVVRLGKNFLKQLRSVETSFFLQSGSRVREFYERIKDFSEGTDVSILDLTPEEHVNIARSATLYKEMKERVKWIKDDTPVIAELLQNSLKVICNLQGIVEDVDDTREQITELSERADVHENGSDQFVQLVRNAERNLTERMSRVPYQLVYWHHLSDSEKKAYEETIGVSERIGASVTDPEKEFLSTMAITVDAAMLSAVRSDDSTYAFHYTDDVILPGQYEKFHQERRESVESELRVKPTRFRRRRTAGAGTYSRVSPSLSAATSLVADSVVAPLFVGFVPKGKQKPQKKPPRSSTGVRRQQQRPPPPQTTLFQQQQQQQQQQRQRLPPATAPPSVFRQQRRPLPVKCPTDQQLISQKAATAVVNWDDPKVARKADVETLTKALGKLTLQTAARSRPVMDVPRQLTLSADVTARDIENDALNRGVPQLSKESTFVAFALQDFFQHLYTKKATEFRPDYRGLGVEQIVQQVPILFPKYDKARSYSDEALSLATTTLLREAFNSFPLPDGRRVNALRVLVDLVEGRRPLGAGDSAKVDPSKSFRIDRRKSPGQIGSKRDLLWQALRYYGIYGGFIIPRGEDQDSEILVRSWVVTAYQKTEIARDSPALMIAGNGTYAKAAHLEELMKGLFRVARGMAYMPYSKKGSFNRNFKEAFGSGNVAQVSYTFLPTAFAHKQSREKARRSRQANIGNLAKQQQGDVSLLLDVVPRYYALLVTAKDAVSDVYTRDVLDENYDIVLLEDDNEYVKARTVLVQSPPRAPLTVKSVLEETLLFLKQLTSDSLLGRLGPVQAEAMEYLRSFQLVNDRGQLAQTVHLQQKVGFNYTFYSADSIGVIPTNTLTLPRINARGRDLAHPGTVLQYFDFFFQFARDVLEPVMRMQQTNQKPEEVADAIRGTLNRQDNIDSLYESWEEARLQHENLEAEFTATKKTGESNVLFESDTQRAGYFLLAMAQARVLSRDDTSAQQYIAFEQMGGEDEGATLVRAFKIYNNAVDLVRRQIYDKLTGAHPQFNALKTVAEFLQLRGEDDERDEPWILFQLLQPTDAGDDNALRINAARLVKRASAMLMVFFGLAYEIAVRGAQPGDVKAWIEVLHVEGKAAPPYLKMPPKPPRGVLDDFAGWEGGEPLVFKRLQSISLKYVNQFGEHDGIFKQAKNETGGILGAPGRLFGSVVGLAGAVGKTLSYQYAQMPQRTALLMRTLVYKRIELFMGRIEEGRAEVAQSAATDRSKEADALQYYAEMDEHLASQAVTNYMEVVARVFRSVIDPPTQEKFMPIGVVEVPSLLRDLRTFKVFNIGSVAIERVEWNTLQKTVLKKLAEATGLLRPGKKQSFFSRAPTYQETWIEKVVVGPKAGVRVGVRPGSPYSAEVMKTHPAEGKNRDVLYINDVKDLKEILKGWAMLARIVAVLGGYGGQSTLVTEDTEEETVDKDALLLSMSGSAGVRQTVIEAKPGSEKALWNYLKRHKNVPVAGKTPLSKPAKAEDLTPEQAEQARRLREDVAEIASERDPNILWLFTEKGELGNVFEGTTYWDAVQNRQKGKEEEREEDVVPQTPTPPPPTPARPKNPKQQRSVRFGGSGTPPPVVKTPKTTTFTGPGSSSRPQWMVDLPEPPSRATKIAYKTSEIVDLLAGLRAAANTPGAKLLTAANLAYRAVAGVFMHMTPNMKQYYALYTTRDAAGPLDRFFDIPNLEPAAMPQKMHDFIIMGYEAAFKKTGDNVAEGIVAQNAAIRVAIMLVIAAAASGRLRVSEERRRTLVSARRGLTNVAWTSASDAMQDIIVDNREKSDIAPTLLKKTPPPPARQRGAGKTGRSPSPPTSKGSKGSRRKARSGVPPKKEPPAADVVPPPKEEDELVPPPVAPSEEYLDALKGLYPLLSERKRAKKLRNVAPLNKAQTWLTKQAIDFTGNEGTRLLKLLFEVPVSKKLPTEPDKRLLELWNIELPGLSKDFREVEFNAQNAATDEDDQPPLPRVKVNWRAELNAMQLYALMRMARSIRNPREESLVGFQELRDDFWKVSALSKEGVKAWPLDNRKPLYIEFGKKFRDYWKSLGQKTEIFPTKARMSLGDVAVKFLEATVRNVPTAEEIDDVVHDVLMKEHGNCVDSSRPVAVVNALKRFDRVNGDVEFAFPTDASPSDKMRISHSIGWAAELMRTLKMGSPVSEELIAQAEEPIIVAKAVDSDSDGEDGYDIGKWE